MDSEAQQSPGLINVLAWIEVHKKKLIWVGAGLVLAIVVTTLWIQQQGQREINASKALSDVRLSFSPANPPTAETAAALRKVADQYRGTKAAARALLMSSTVLFTERQYDQAMAGFNKLIADYPDGLWVADAHLGIAATVEAQGKSAEATNKFAEVIRRFSTSPVADDAKLALARAYEQVDTKDAREAAFKLYDELVKGGAGAGGALAQEAREFMMMLQKKHPELALVREPMQPVPPPITITPTTNTTSFTSTVNRAAASNVPVRSLSNIIQRMATNMQSAIATNLPGASSPVKVELPPGATAPKPGVVPAPAAAPAPPPASPAPVVPPPTK